MKRLVVIFILVLFWGNVFAAAFAIDNVVSIEPKDNVLKVKTTKTKYLNSKILDNDPEKIKLILKLQKEKDVEDLESLWKATVDRNSAIKFALQKLSSPAEQRKIHSSMMAKTVSTLINGASMVPFMVGANYGLQSASLASGQIANRLFSKKDMPKTMPLTDTELIQLSDLVEGLQNDLVKSYYDYKSSINSLKECREKLIVEQKNYNIALKQDNRFYMIVSSAVYDDKMLEEIQLKEKVKLNRLKLERLAGHEAVEQLNLSRIVLNKDCRDEI